MGPARTAEKQEKGKKNEASNMVAPLSTKTKTLTVSIKAICTTHRRVVLILSLANAESMIPGYRQAGKVPLADSHGRLKRWRVNCGVTLQSH
jgi:hypothetical protein